MSDVNIRDPFAHEAAHALVYDAFEMPVARVWVQADDAGREGGLTERGTDTQMTHGAGVLEFMSGAGVLVYIFGQSFERTVNKVKSDICTLLRLLKPASEQEARTQLERLRLAIDEFVGDWVMTNKDTIMRLATLLQQSRVGEMRWELSGSALRGAIQRSWGERKQSATITQAFADSGWKAILDRIEVDWQTIVIRHCTANGDPMHKDVKVLDNSSSGRT